MIDTCQAATMFSKFYSPNIIATGSSQIKENSYSVRCFVCSWMISSDISLYLKHHNDMDIGVAVIDSFTHHVLQFMEGINKTSQASLQDLVGC